MPGVVRGVPSTVTASVLLRPPKRENMSKNIETYFKTITFKKEPTYLERESIVKRAIIQEQSNTDNKSLRWIVVDKDINGARIKFFRKVTKKKKGKTTIV
jgi:hypothetical protein